MSEARGRELLEEVERRTRFGFPEPEAFVRTIAALVDGASRQGTEQSLKDCNAETAFLALEITARSRQRRAQNSGCPQ